MTRNQIFLMNKGLLIAVLNAKGLTNNPNPEVGTIDDTVENQLWWMDQNGFDPSRPTRDQVNQYVEYMLPLNDEELDIPFLVPVGSSHSYNVDCQTCGESYNETAITVRAGFEFSQPQFVCGPECEETYLRLT